MNLIRLKNSASTLASVPPPKSRYTIYQRWACNNSAKKSFQATKLLLIALCLYSLWLLHLKTGTLTFTIPVVTITICSYSRDRGTTLARKICPNAKFANNLQICESELTCSDAGGPHTPRDSPPQSIICK